MGDADLQGAVLDYLVNLEALHQRVDKEGQVEMLADGLGPTTPNFKDTCDDAATKTRIDAAASDYHYSSAMIEKYDGELCDLLYRQQL